VLRALLESSLTLAALCIRITGAKCCQFQARRKAAWRWPRVLRTIHDKRRYRTSFIINKSQMAPYINRDTGGLLEKKNVVHEHSNTALKHPAEGDLRFLSRRSNMRVRLEVVRCCDSRRAGWRRRPRHKTYLGRKSVTKALIRHAWCTFSAPGCHRHRTKVDAWRRGPRVTSSSRRLHDSEEQRCRTSRQFAPHE
jgi:hypothetical protein